MRNYFEEISGKILKTRQRGEHFLIGISGEKSQFIRINAAKIRQIGVVEDANLEITLIAEDSHCGLRKTSGSLTLSGLIGQDWKSIQEVLSKLRTEISNLPVDPFAEIPENYGSLVTEAQGGLLEFAEAPEILLNKHALSLDVAGIYASGPIFRGMANSVGQNLWFSTESFSFDYSIYTQNKKALKATYAGSKWNQSDYLSKLEGAPELLKVLGQPEKRVPRGSHRAYLAPDAVGDLIAMFSWGGVSEYSIRQGDSPLRFLRQGERQLSSQFSLSEDFSLGQVPRFNHMGEIAMERIPVIEKGQLRNSLVSTRTAKEYGTQSNAALASETLRYPVLEPGSLNERDVLKSLDTGLYLSNLHYLNWSDQSGGRVTGMTRYACFWVENGKIVAPIENMRWDDSIFNFFGSELESLTQSRSTLADVMTYEKRSLGGSLMPGILVNKVLFTI